MSWIEHNLNGRDFNKTYDFKVTINTFPVNYTSLEDACIKRAKKIYCDHKRLYLSYSGGLDSEYVLKIFNKAGVPIIPVIISTEFNKEEVEYAIKYCKNNNIDYRLIELPAEKFIEKLYYKTYAKGLYTLLGGVPDLVHDYFGGTVITGSPSFSCDEDPNMLEICEYELYEHGGNVINFMFDPEILCAIAIELDPKVSTQEAKIKMYGLEPRSKMRWNTEFFFINNKLRPFNFNYRYMIDREEFINKFTLFDMPFEQC